MLFFSILQPVVFAQVHIELGQLEVENFSPKVYKSHPQNWTIEQGKDGIMYFGNNQGILVYDGHSWELIKTANESTVRSLDVSPRGKIYVGASGDFGYLTSDKHGKLKYVSLSKLFNLSEQQVGDVYGVSAFDQGVYFRTDRNIYLYSGKNLQLWESEGKFQYGIKKDGAYIVNHLDYGLSKMLDDSLVPMNKVHSFKSEKIYDIQLAGSDKLLVLIDKLGFRSYQTGEFNQQYLDSVNKHIKFYNPYNFSFVKNKFLCVGTWGNGLVFLDEKGKLVQQLTTESGLLDEVITDQFLDKQGNVWLTTSNGISKVSISENISAFRSAVNVDETIEKIVRFNDKLYLATHTGLYSWEEDNKVGTFKRVAGINTECWDILPIEVDGKLKLLIAGNNAVYELDENDKLNQIVTCLPWTFHKLNDEKSTVFVGLDDGLMSLNFDEGKWRVQSKIAGISNTIYSIAQSEENRVWLGTLNHGVIRLDMTERITHYPYQFYTKKFDKNDGLPEGGIYPCKYVGGMLFGSGNGIFEYHESENKFIEEKIYKESIGRKNVVVHRLSEDADGRLWLIGYWDEEFMSGYFERNGSKPQWKGTDLKPVTNEVFHAIHHDPKGITWLGGPDGLFRYDPIKEDDILQVKNSVLIRKVHLNKDSLDFAGNINYPNYKDSLSETRKELKYPYEFNSLTFLFASQFHKFPKYNEYSYMLMGFDDDWSEWSKEEKAVYTNLHEGDYIFMVKTKNVYGVESEASPYQFTIKSPWYRTWWAYIIYAVLSVVVVYFVVIMYTKKLKEIIKERTAEVVEQKEKIEKQKDEVERQRQLLEVKNNDITSSINYAKRLQEALLPNDEMINKYLNENFILYKPKDIVSGDFYWMEHVNGSPQEDATLFATVDCTGHGVPGAFVSVVGNSGLNRAVNEFGLRQPAEILDKLNEIVVDTLSKGDQELRDGMDISLCRFDFNKMELEFAGANNSVYVFRKDIIKMEHGLNGNSKFFKEDMLEIKANKQPVGYYEFRKNFKNNVIKLEKGDVIYLFSDGYTDQFGGPSGKKYNVVRFRNFLMSIYDQPMSAQKDLIDKEFESWRGQEEQVDDVIVVGIRV